MKPSEVAKSLGITTDRIKYFKKKGVFTPERPPAEGKPTDYTDRDVAELKKLVILSALSLSCGDIKKLQNGSWTLKEALAARKQDIEARWTWIGHSLELIVAVMADNAQFDTLNVDYYWSIITGKKPNRLINKGIKSNEEATK